jgi:hypothetical protein
VSWMKRYAAGIAETFEVESVEPFDSATIFSLVAAGAMDPEQSLHFLEIYANELLGEPPGRYFIGLSYALGPVTDGEMTSATVEGALHSQDGSVSEEVESRFRESVDLAVLRGGTARVSR